MDVSSSSEKVPYERERFHWTYSSDQETYTEIIITQKALSSFISELSSNS